MRYKREIIGHKFAKFTVIKYSHTIKRVTYWICECVCGKHQIIPRCNFRSSNSCGCLAGNKRPDSMVNRVFRDYKNRARLKNLEFKLTKGEFNELISSKCMYCGEIQSNTKKHEGNYFEYNGIDRINSDIGYIKDNCVTCCKHCNIAKNTLTMEEFKELINKIYHNFILGTIDDKNNTDNH